MIKLTAKQAKYLFMNWSSDHPEAREGNWKWWQRNGGEHCLGNGAKIYYIRHSRQYSISGYGSYADVMEVLRDILVRGI